MLGTWVCFTEMSSQVPYDAYAQTLLPEEVNRRDQMNPVAIQMK